MMRYFTFIIVFVLLAGSAAAFVPVRTLEPVPVTVIAPVEQADVPEEEPPEEEPTVVLHKVDVSSSEVLDINKEGSDPEEETAPSLDTFQPETDVRPDGIIDEETMEPLDSLEDEDTYKADKTTRSHGNPEPWSSREMPPEPLDKVVMPVDPIEMPPDPLERRAMPVDPIEMPPDPLDKEGVVDNKYPENKPTVFSRMWSGFVRLFTWQSPEARGQFTESMEGSDLAMYDGHGRYGSGPDMDGKGDSVPDRVRERHPDAGLRLSGDIGGKYYDGKVDIDASIGLEEKSLEGKGDDVRQSMDGLHEGHQTFWARVKSWFSLKGRGYNELPEVDDEVDVSLETAGASAEEAMMDLDSAAQRRDQMMSAQSSIMKKMSDTRDNITKNIK